MFSKNKCQINNRDSSLGVFDYYKGHYQRYWTFNSLRANSADDVFSYIYIYFFLWKTGSDITCNGDNLRENLFSFFGFAYLFGCL